MTGKLMILESAAKAKKIAAFLGDGWRVEATRGHVRDLPQDRLGVDVKADFRPLYDVLPRQVNTVRRLLKAIREVDPNEPAAKAENLTKIPADYVEELVKPKIWAGFKYYVLNNIRTPF